MTAAALATSLPGADGAASLVAHQLRIGSEYYTAGRIEEAIDAYQDGLAAALNQAPGCVSQEMIADLHARLGNACMARSDFELAATSYKAALRLAAHLTSCWWQLRHAF